MVAFVKRLTRPIDRLRYLRAAMPLLDALRIMYASNSSPEQRIFLHQIERNVYIRPQISDLKCLEKVFIHREYQLPFELRPKLIVDAGANIGMATLFFAHQYPDARIVAIEPEPANFELLSKNCANVPNVILIQAALWPTQRDLLIENPSSEAWAFSVNEAPFESRERTVAAITIGDILKRTSATKVDLLKLDIEGSELQLFSERAERWLNHVGIIAIELHDRYRPGCTKAFYSALMSQRFIQEIRGENVFVKLLGKDEEGASPARQQSRSHL